MVIVEFRDIEIDYCPECRGTWLDTGETDFLFDAAGITDYHSFLDGIISREEAPSVEKKRKCPICLEKMKKVNAAGEKDSVIVDVCPAGDGIWFDHREIERLAAAVAGEKDGEGKAPALIRDLLGEVFRY